MDLTTDINSGFGRDTKCIVKLFDSICQEDLLQVIKSNNLSIIILWTAFGPYLLFDINASTQIGSF